MEQSPSEIIESKIEGWKVHGQIVRARIIGKDKEELADVYVQTYTPAQKKIRALKSFSIWWGIALVSALIPPHVLWPPLFGIIGIIIPVSVHGKKSVILGGNGKCPYCSKEFEIARNADRWPMDDICSSCHRHVRVEKA